MTYKDDCIDSNITEVPDLVSWCYPGQFRSLARIHFGDIISHLRTQFHSRPNIQIEISSPHMPDDKYFAVEPSIGTGTSSSVKVINQFVAAPSILIDIDDITLNQVIGFNSAAAPTFYFNSNIQANRNFLSAASITFVIDDVLLETLISFSSQADIDFDIDSALVRLCLFESTAAIAWAVSADINAINKFVVSPVIQTDLQADIFKAYSFAVAPAIGFDTASDIINPQDFASTANIVNDISSDIQKGVAARIDFTDGFTEIDAGNDDLEIVSPTLITIDLMRRDVWSGIYKDMGADWLIGDFKFDFYFTAFGSTEIYPLIIPFVLTEGGYYYRISQYNNSDGLGILWAHGAGYELYDLKDGVSDSYAIPLTPPVEAWCTIERIGVTVTFKLYSDSARQTLIDTMSITQSAPHSYRYLHPISSLGSGTEGHREISGTVEDMDYLITNKFVVSPTIQTAISSDIIGVVDRDFVSTANIVSDIQSDINGNREFASTANIVSSISSDIEVPETAWLGFWLNRIEFTVSSALIDADLTDFPVALQVSASAGIGNRDLTDFFDTVTFADRKKIAVTDEDGVTQLPVEIDSFDYAQESAVLHVKVPSVLAATDKKLYLYYGGTTDNSMVGDVGDAIAQTVWDDDFSAVWHMSQDPSGGADCMIDSTSPASPGTPGGSMTTGDLVDGPSGKAIDFDGGDDYINFGSAAELDDISLLTCEVLFNATGWGESGSGRMVQKANVNTLGWNFIIEDDKDGLYFLRESTGGLGLWYTGAILSLSNWYHGVVIHDTTSINNDPVFYLDGVFRSTFEDPSSISTGSWASDAAQDLWVGARNNTGPDREFNGKMGEVRISKVIRSAAWLKATYKTLIDTLLTAAAPETIPVEWLGTWANRVAFTIDSSLVDADLIDFPVALQVSGSAGIGSIDLTDFFDKLGSDVNRKKIAVTDAAGTELPVEIDYFSYAQESAIFHVKVPSILAASDTTIYLYYDEERSDNSMVGDTGESAAETVWDNNFKAVWHMAQDPGSSNILDSTGVNDGVPGGGMTSGDLVDGLFGKALNFDIAEHLVAGDDTSLDITSQLSIEALVKPDISNSLMFFAGRDGASGRNYYLLVDTNNKPDFTIWHSNGSFEVIEANTTLPTDAWTYIAGTYDHANLNIYTDGAVDATPIALSNDIDNDDVEFSIAAREGGADRRLDGNIGEIRISATARSAAWVKATYNTLYDTLLSASVPSTMPVKWLMEGSTPWAYRIPITIDSSKIDAELTDFPLAVQLSDASGTGSMDASHFFSEMSEGFKVAFTTADGITQLFAELEFIEIGNKKALYHVKVPIILSGIDTIIYFYYDSSMSANSAKIGDVYDRGCENVWDDDFIVVNHLSTTPSGDNSVLDSTSNALHMESVGMDAGDVIDSIGILKGYDFDAVDNAIKETGLTYNGNPLKEQHTALPVCYEAIAKANSPSTGFQIVDNQKSGSAYSTFNLQINAINKARFTFYYSGSSNRYIESPGTMGTGWHYMSAQYVKGTDGLRMIIDDAVPLTLTTSDTPIYPTNDFLRGAYWDSDGNPVSRDGGIGEYRMSKITRSDAWLYATYETLFDSLQAYSNVESWLDGYDQRIEVRVDNTQIDAELTDFPLAMILNDLNASELFTELGTGAGPYDNNTHPNRKKIAVTSLDGVRLDTELDWSDIENSLLVIHSKIPTILDTEYTRLFIYFNSAAADSDEVGDAGSVDGSYVWDSDFLAVYHMTQDPSGGTDAIINSVADVSHGTSSGSMTTGDLVDGLCAKAIDFDGSDDYINFGSAVNLDDLVLMTIETVFNATGWGEGTSGRMVQKSTINDGWSFLIQQPNTTLMVLVGSSGGLGQWRGSTGLINLSTWYYGAYTHDRSNINIDPLIYHNGIASPVFQDTAPGGTWGVDASDDLWVGARNNSGPDREYDGKIDEVRISKVIRTPAWLKATHYGLMLNSTLLSFGYQTRDSLTFYIPEYIDLTTFTEVDPDGDITITSTKAEYDTMSMLVAAYVYKDFGAAHFGDFDMEFENEITFSESDNGSNNAASVLFCISNTVGTWPDWDLANDGIMVDGYNLGTGGFVIRLRDFSNDDSDTVNLGVTDTHPRYYFTFSRSGATTTLEIYHDSEKTNLLDTLSVTGDTEAKQYMYCLGSRNTGSTSIKITGYNQNFLES